MSSKFKILCGAIALLTIIAIFVNLSIGFVDLGFSDFFGADSFNSQIAQLRVNRVVVMLLAGISVPTSGFLLQEYFQNPLAGPSVLGITSVASLSVALYIFLSQDFALPEFLQNSLISSFAIAGSFAMMILLLFFSKKFQNQSYLIIFGFLISALSGALVSILQFYAESQSLKNYILWSFGANNQVTPNQIFVLILFISAGFFFSFRSIKPLIGISLGSSYAQTMGVNLLQLRFFVVIASSLLSASVTAFLGPILFIGIVVPHFCRMIWNPSQLWHQWILNMVLGMLIMETFSIVSELSQFPINIITSLFGIPVILVMLLNQKKIR